MFLRSKQSEPRVPKRARILGDAPKAQSSQWFRIALLALPLATFTAVLIAPWLSKYPPQANASEAIDVESAQFDICVGSDRVTCIVDGDTLWYRGTKIRIADIDTPEISNPACPREAQKGGEATRRMRELLNSGPFTLSRNPDGRVTDRYGRALHIVTRDGKSLGQRLVREGLAAKWGGAARDWC